MEHRVPVFQSHGGDAFCVDDSRSGIVDKDVDSFGVEGFQCRVDKHFTKVGCPSVGLNGNSLYSKTLELGDSLLRRSGRAVVLNSDLELVSAGRLMHTRRRLPTLAPCSANAIALAAPMPFGFPAPVTMATFPFKDCEAIVSG